jgi:hypothetical protein
MSDVEVTEKKPTSWANEEIKTLIVAVPLAASMIAMTYNVGYFSGIDIKVFSLFSLTEHIVFAIEALPLAFGLMFGSFVSIASLSMPKGKNTTVIGRWLIQRKVVGLAFSLLLLGVIAYLINSIHWFVISGLVFVAIFMYESLRKRFSANIAILFGAVIVFTVIFIIGYDQGARLLRSRLETHFLQVDGTTLAGRLVRGGEKGILFVRADSKELLFVRWDNIKSLKTVQVPLTFENILKEYGR